MGTNVGESNTAPKRVVAVLGMHRGGTSAITRGIACLGVELGDRLLEGEESQNPRGFFEDEPLLEISDRVLENLGLGWESTQLIAPSEWKRADLYRLRLQAVETIERRFGSTPIWGFKNPRSPRLMSFWKSVFSLVDRSDSYVIALRNPLSVARSLHARNGFSARRSYLLWLIHQVQSVANTKGKPRVCVEFDLLLQDPERQLRRIASALDLPGPSKASLDAFTGDFLSEDLRHSRFDQEDVAIDPDLSELGRRAYEILHRWACDDADAAKKIDRAMNQIHRRLLEISPVFAELDDLEARIRDERGINDRSVREWQEERQGFVDLAKDHATTEESLRRELSRMEETLGVSNAAMNVQKSARESTEARAATLEARMAEMELSRDVLAKNHASLVDEGERLRQALERERLELSARTDEVAARDRQIETERREAQRKQRDAVDQRAAAEQLNEALKVELDDIRASRQSDIARLTSNIDVESNRVREFADLNRDLMTELDRERQRFESEVELRDQAERERIAALERDFSNRLDAAVTSHETSRQEFEAWAAARAHSVALSIGQHAEATSQTRNWRVARRLQRLLDRLRWRSPQDGLQHVIQLAQMLEVRSMVAAPDLRELSAKAETLSTSVHQVLEGEIVASLRAIARAGRRLLGLSVNPGPADRLFDEAIEVAFFLKQIEASPPLIDASGTPAKGPSGPTVDAQILVDVVVPVYGAPVETRRCVESLLSAENTTPHQIVVVDDGNRDPRILRFLDDCASDDRITLLRNDENLGFPLAANRGLSLHPERDVVLLNSDTRVSNHWLDRLRRAARSDWKIATATPFSNDGEICSWPQQVPRAAAPDDSELDRINVLLADVNEGRTLTIPTAVGFCVYITRESIREIGVLDADSFGRGYGEESDFSMRARAMGYRNVLAADVFVAHEGSRSFGPEKAERLQHAAKMISLRHPQYTTDVDRFIEADPARPLRRLIAARVSTDSDRPKILMISHARGGGTERQIAEMKTALESEGIGTLSLQPTSRGSVRLSWDEDQRDEADLDHSDDMVFDLESEMASLVETLRAFNVRHIHIHHILDHPLSVTSLPQSMQVPFDVTLHDYFSICPRIHLANESNGYCGEPTETDCNACVGRNGSELGHSVDVLQWRNTTHAWLQSARRIFVPSADTALRFSRYFPDLTFTERPHPSVGSTEAKRARTRTGSSKGDRRIAVVGAVNAHKGSDTLLALVRDADARQLPLRFEIIGHTDRNAELEESSRVSVSGPYDREDLPRLLDRSKCPVAFFPTSIPETFSYTLSEVLAAGLYPIAFAIGAPAERIRNNGWGQLLPLDLDPSGINDALVSLDIPETPAPVIPGIRYDSLLRDYYELHETTEWVRPL